MACAVISGVTVSFTSVARTPLLAQQPAFRASTDAIWVTATAVDKDGGLVTNLTKDDFESFDNGERRDITLFRNDPVPFSIAVMIDISGSMRDVGLFSQQAEFRAPPPEAVPPNTTDYVTFARNGIAELINQFQPGDRATMGAFTSIAAIDPSFTGIGRHS